MEQKSKTHIAKGTVIGLVLIVYTIILTITGQMFNKLLGNLAYLILLIGLIICGTLYSKENNANVTFGNVFAYCFKVNTIVTLIVILWAIISAKFVFPNTKEDMASYTQKALEKLNYPDDQITYQVSIIKKGFWILLTAGNLLIYAIAGAISSLIAAAIAKKNPVQPFQQV